MEESKMNTQYNINAIMCERADEDVLHIDNIFNTIELEHEGTISFDVVTFLNCIGEPRDFNLIYMLQHVMDENKGRVTFLSATQYNYDKECGEKNYTQNIERTHYSGVNMDGKGKYVLVVYKYEEELLRQKGIDLQNDFEDWISKLEDEKIAATYQFQVEIKRRK